MSSEITLSALMAEYQRLNIDSKKDSDGLTSNEWANHWGIGVKQAREVIRKFCSSGWVTIGKKWTIAIDGRASMVPAYKIELPKSEQKKTSRKK